MKKDRKPNEMLERIKKQPSYKNISSRQVTASGPILPDDILSSKYAKETPIIAKKAEEFDKLKNELADALEAAKEERKIVGQVTKEADEAYKATKKFRKLPSILGLLPMAVASALATYSPGSKAAKIASKVSDEGDPSSILFPSEAGEGEKEEIEKMYEEAIRDRNKPQKELQEIVNPMIKEVGGEPDIRPEKAIKMVGEKEIEDMDQNMELTRENYEKLLKRQLGYYK